MAKPKTPGRESTPPKLSPAEGAARLRDQITKGRSLMSSRPLARDQYSSWELVTRNYLEMAFGSDSPNIKNIMDVGKYGGFNMYASEAELERDRAGNLQTQLTRLEGLAELLDGEAKHGQDTPHQDRRPAELGPATLQYDVFISYATGDSAIAAELRDDLEAAGCRCFMAEKDIQVATEWQDAIRTALLGSRRVLVLLTPRSANRPWVLMETGAAWALGKPLIPALSHVAVADLPDPMRRYQARVIETTAQRKALVGELTGA